jgi:hypothetical protein
LATITLRAVAAASGTRSVPVPCHDRPQPGRGLEDVIGKPAAQDDAIGVAREAADSRRIAVGRADQLRAACEQLFASRRDRVGEQDAVHG